MARLREIRTERLRLIALSPLDAAEVTALISDWDVIRMLARAPYPYTIDDARAWLAKAQDYPWEFAIYTDRLMGVVGITGHLGYWMGKAYWGRGFMTEATRALVDAYFDRAASDQIVSGHFDENPASGRVLSKLGFVETGRSQQFCRPRGAKVPHIEMALSRETWQATRGAALDEAAH